MIWWIMGGIALLLLGFVCVYEDSFPTVVYCSKCKHCNYISKDSWCLHPKHITKHTNFYEEVSTTQTINMNIKNIDNKCKDFEWSQEELNKMIPDRGN